MRRREIIFFLENHHFVTKTQKLRFLFCGVFKKKNLIFYLNANVGCFLICIYVLSKLIVKYKLKANEDIYLNDINNKWPIVVTMQLRELALSHKYDHEMNHK